MGLFKFIADVVTIPLDVVADVSSAIQGEEPDHTEKKARKIERELSDFVDGI